MESVGKEIVFDVIERPNHPVTRGKERDPIANPKPEATQTNELERTSDVGPAIYRKHIILALRGARHFDAQGAACILREVSVDRERSDRRSRRDDSVVDHVATDHTGALEEPRIDNVSV